MAQRFFWLKLKDDFFRQLPIKKLRRIAGGDTYTVIYLKMMLLTIKTDGLISYDCSNEEFISNLALDIDEDEDNVEITINFLLLNGLAERHADGEMFLPQAKAATGSEGTSAERMRQLRARVSEGSVKPPAKSDAERKRMQRAKDFCSKSQHIPMIDDYMNKKRYNGNYYIVFKRDSCKCQMCGNVENLCVHHIDGFDENNPQNSNTNKMVVLCRECHSNIHAGEEIPKELLEKIYYYDEDVTSHVFCDSDVTGLLCHGDVEIEIEKDIEIDNTLRAENISINDKDYKKLVDLAGSEVLLKEVIECASSWKNTNAKGKKIKNDYLFIRNWLKRELEKKPTTAQGSDFDVVWQEVLRRIRGSWSTDGWSSPALMGAVKAVGFSRLQQCSSYDLEKMKRALFDAYKERLNG